MASLLTSIIKGRQIFRDLSVTYYRNGPAFRLDRLDTTWNDSYFLCSIQYLLAPLEIDYGSYV